MKKLLPLILLLISVSAWADLNSSLIDAIQEKKYDKVIELMENGANALFPYENGKTALHLAAEQGDVKMLRLLMMKKPFVTTDRFLLAWPVAALVAVIFLVLAFLIGILYSHKLAGPIYRVEKSIMALIHGQSDFKIKLRKKDEFKNLADTFNRLIDYFKLNKETITAVKTLLSEYEDHGKKEYLEKAQDILGKALQEMEN